MGFSQVALNVGTNGQHVSRQLQPVPWLAAQGNFPVSVRAWKDEL